MTLYLSETTLFYHQLRTSTGVPSAAYPNTKSSVGLINQWANIVADAGRSTPSLSYSTTQAGSGCHALASGSLRTASVKNIEPERTPTPVKKKLTCSLFLLTRMLS